MVLTDTGGTGPVVPSTSTACRPSTSPATRGTRLPRTSPATHGPARGCGPPRDARGPVRVLRWSGGGDPASALVKPDLVAPATGRLGALPPRPDGNRFGFLTGTSAAAAHVSGVAALLRARHPAGRRRRSGRR